VPGVAACLAGTPDGCLYLQYRSVFHMLRGRSEWLHLVGEKPEGPMFEERFEASFRNFELARGGLGQSNFLLAALNELYVVEACLGQARIKLGWARKARLEDQLAAMEEAGAKYETARFALQRAHRAMLATRRNVIWWRFYYMMVSQYHADRLLMGFAQIVQNWPRTDNTKQRYPLSGSLAQYLVRLRRGYGSLRNAADYRLPSQGTPAEPMPWLKRIWRELTFIAYAAGFVALRGHVANEYTRTGAATHPYGDEQSYVWDLLKWLNESAGLQESLGDIVNQGWLHSSELDGISRQLVNDYFSNSGSRRLPLEVRWDLMRLASHNVVARTDDHRGEEVITKTQSQITAFTLPQQPEELGMALAEHPDPEYAQKVLDFFFKPANQGPEPDSKAKRSSKKRKRKMK
jgi:hypothetical protein